MLNKNKYLALFEVLITVVAVFAFAHSLGSVSAENVPVDPDATAQQRANSEATQVPGSTVVAVLPVANSGLKKVGLDIPKTLFGERSTTGLGAQSKATISGAGGSGTVGASIGTKAFFSNLAKNAFVAVAIYAGLYYVGNLIAPEQKAAIGSVARAVSVGYIVGTTAADFAKTAVGQTLGFDKFLGFIGGPAVLGLGIGAIILITSFRLNEEKQVNFQCVPWQAPTGGEKCEECGKDGLPCTEYQCMSLGQACELINEGTADQGCIWKDRNDVRPPVITPMEDALLSENYAYKPDTAISPPDRGVFVRYDFGCIPAFTPFQFGVKTDERAVCKISDQRVRNMTDMQWYFGGINLLTYNHTQPMPTASREALEADNISVENNGEYSLYVRCQDANGNANTANFVFKYCVDPGPDTTAPKIKGTNYDGVGAVPVGFNQTTLGILLYVNEPAECKWSHDRDLDYSQMTGNMTCATRVTEINAEMVYTCSTTLDAIKSRQLNDFYFRCKDKPFSPENERNTNTEGFKFSVAGTQPLVIDEVGPTGVMRDSTSTVRVNLTAKTSAGYKEGEAKCYYSPSGNEGTFNEFIDTDSYTHAQDLYLVSGDYRYTIKCIDAGGNEDRKTTVFRIETDNSPPEIVRAYHEENYLKIITGESGQCVYSLQSCSYLFGDGVEMNAYEGTEHFVDWNLGRTYYIKCADRYNNQPQPNECSIVVRPFQFFEQEE